MSKRKIQRLEKTPGKEGALKGRSVSSSVIVPVVVTGFLLFAHFGLLQTWRYVSGLRSAPTSLALMILAGGMAVWGYALIESVSSDENMTYSPSKKNTFLGLAVQDWVVLLICVLFGFLLWLFWIEPSLSRSLDVRGDEDHHFTVTYWFTEYFRDYVHFRLPDKPVPGGLRYTNLMNLWNLWFLNPFTGPVNTPYLQRFPLLFPYLATVGVCFILSFRILKERTLSLLFTIVFASCPLLLCYTGDKYLDIGHPMFFALSSYWMYQLVVSRSNFAALMTALSTCLLSLVRDNSGITTLLYGGILFLFFSPLFGFAPLKMRSWKNAFLYFLTTVLPFLIFYRIKSIHTSIDSSRLAFRNLLNQNYGDFFQYLLIYTPFIFLIVPFLFLLREVWPDQKKKPIGMIVVLLSLFSQLFAYGLFEPGWMPWSRNYMMFIGQLSILSLIAFSVIAKSQSKWAKPLTVSILIFCLGFNLVFGSKELRSNRYFHENELHYDYQALYSRLMTQQVIPPRAKVFMNLPEGMNRSMTYSATQVGYPVENLSFLVTIKEVFFKKFLSAAPPEAEYFLFHYRVFQTIMPILQSPVDRPTELELSGYEVLLDLPDAWSNKMIGLLLFKKIKH